MSRLTTISHVLAYDNDEAGFSSRKPIDWPRTIRNVTVRNPGNQKYDIEPLGAKTIFDGTRTLGLDGTTTFSISPVSGQPSTYRLTVTAGTSPGFRVNRALALSGIATTLTLNANLSGTLTVSAGTPFASLVVGDVVFIAGTSTGDVPGPFSALNEGYWTVLTAGGASISVIRDPSQVFTGSTEVVTPSTNLQVVAFAPSGVQVGDTVELLAGFASTALRAYEIAGVNPNWLEVVSTRALGSQIGITPDVAGMVVYTTAKRYVHIEVNQECVVHINGDTGSAVVLAPWVPGDWRLPGEYRQTGSVWSLRLVNKSTLPLEAVVLTAE